MLLGEASSLVHHRIRLYLSNGGKILAFNSTSFEDVIDGASEVKVAGVTVPDARQVCLCEGGESFVVLPQSRITAYDSGSLDGALNKVRKLTYARVECAERCTYSEVATEWSMGQGKAISTSIDPMTTLGTDTTIRLLKRMLHDVGMPQFSDEAANRESEIKPELGVMHVCARSHADFDTLVSKVMSLHQNGVIDDSHHCFSLLPLQAACEVGETQSSETRPRYQVSYHPPKLSPVHSPFNSNTFFEHLAKQRVRRSVANGQFGNILMHCDVVDSTQTILEK
jgi:hypothetical protein